MVPYNFSSAGQISTEQLRAISMLNDLFARNLTHNLAAWLRTRFQVNLVSAEQIQFNEFLLRIPEISYVASVRLEPLGALSVLQLDLALAPPDHRPAAGRRGQATAPLRELTDIEESILGSVVEIICRELTAAWQPVGLSFNFERRQMQTQVARIMSVNEKTLCLSFEIRMPHSSGLLNLAFPAVVANTILRRLTSDWGRHAAMRRRPGCGWRPRRAVSALAASLQLPPVRLRGRARSRTWSRATCCASISPPTRCPTGGWAASRCPRRRPSARARTAPPASSASDSGGRRMKTYLDCWATVAAALFSQALAGEPELIERLPKPLAAGSFGFAATLAGDQEGRFAVVLDRRGAGDAAAGRGRGPEGRLGGAAARGGRRRCRRTAGQDRQQVPRREVRRDRGREQDLAGLSAEVRRPALEQFWCGMRCAHAQKAEAPAPKPAAADAAAAANGRSTSPAAPPGLPA